MLIFVYILTHFLTQEVPPVLTCYASADPYLFYFTFTIVTHNTALEQAFLNDGRC